MPKPQFRISYYDGPTGKMPRISASQRANVEKAYGYQISKSAWVHLEIHTAFYIFAASSERNAVPVKNVLKKLTTLRKAALSFIREITKEDSTESLTLQQLDKRYFHARPGEALAEPSHLILLLLHCANAAASLSSYALKHLSGPEPIDRGFPEGYFWNLWINQVTSLMKSEKLPTSARKDTDKRKTTVPSAFVYLIFALQKEIPEEYRRQMPQTSSKDESIYLDALAQAIYRARRVK